MSRHSENFNIRFATKLILLIMVTMFVSRIIFDRVIAKFSNSVFRYSITTKYLLLYIEMSLKIIGRSFESHILQCRVGLTG